MKHISIIGSTGSIGKKAVSLAVKSPEKYCVELIVGFSNVKLLAEQALLTGCKNVCILDETLGLLLCSHLSGSQVKVHVGHEQMMELLDIKVDWAINCVTGFAGLPITFKLVYTEVPVVALANKESIICGGNILLGLAHSKNITILPVDSEHNSIFRILEGNNKSVSHVTITASGGPFLRYSPESIARVTVDQATKHPIWEMGKKISIDSATMMNKSLELLEAHYLFDGIPVDVTIHPESIIHGVVHYNDGTMMALLHYPDMIFPIAHALSWPSIHELGKNIPQLGIHDLCNLTFIKPDFQLFPALKLGYDVLNSSDPHKNGIMLNAANEIAVNAFLNYKICFTEIPMLVESSLSMCPNMKINSLHDIMEFDNESRRISTALLEKPKVYASMPSF